MSAEMPKVMSADEIRREMRSRFDAANEAAEKSRRTSRDAGTIRDAGEKQRWAKRDVDTGDTGGAADTAENDAPGG